MRARSRRLVLALASFGILFASAFDAGAQTRRMAPAVQAQEAQIYLIRGLFGVFSSGMDQLARDFQKQGYSDVSLWSWTDVETIVHDIVSGQHRGDESHIVLIGHSLGANAVVQVADRLGQAGIDVDLAVTFDITEELVVPLNVGAFINFYQNNGFGRPARAAEGFKGQFSNIDLTGDPGLNHDNIDSDPQSQAFVLQRVYDRTHRQIQTVDSKRKGRPRG